MSATFRTIAPMRSMDREWHGAGRQTTARAEVISIWASSAPAALRMFASVAVMWSRGPRS